MRELILKKGIGCKIICDKQTYAQLAIFWGEKEYAIFQSALACAGTYSLYCEETKQYLIGDMSQLDRVG